MIGTTKSSHRQLLHRSTLVAAAIGILVLAGCSGADAKPGAAGSAGPTETTVTVRDAAGHADVLTAADGRTLYLSDQEHGAVLCKSSDCTAVWLPLTVDAGKDPTGPTQLSGKLSTVMRPDGTAQVTLGDKPLYTFSFDQNAGEVGGDGQTDSFGGTDFTWHVATTGGRAPAPSVPASPSDGGYNY